MLTCWREWEKLVTSIPPMKRVVFVDEEREGERQREDERQRARDGERERARDGERGHGAGAGVGGGERQGSSDLALRRVGDSIADYVRRGEFRCIGVMRVPVGESGELCRRWVLVRPGLVRPLAGLHGKRRTLVFDLNRVLGVRWHDEEHRFREGIEVNLRIGRHQAVLFRPGARKLLKMLHAAGQDIWFWSTMQRSSVLAWRRALAEFVPEEHCLSGDDCPEPDLKDLSVVWRRLGGGGDVVRKEDVWMIDDDPTKVRLHPDRFIQAVPYEPRDPFDPVALSDGGMGALMARIVGAV